MTIIGIAGGTGSGKTTVVKKIAQALPPHCAAVVPLDSYYNDTTGMTDEERRAINFDHPDAFDWKLLTEHIKLLKSGQPVEQPTYSYIISNRLPETIHVEPKPVIILEGIMTLHYKKLRDMMDLKIFVDTDADVRLIRNIRRDVVECLTDTKRCSNPCMSSLSSLPRSMPTLSSRQAVIIKPAFISSEPISRVSLPMCRLAIQ